MLNDRQHRTRDGSQSERTDRSPDARDEHEVLDDNRRPADPNGNGNGRNDGSGNRRERRARWPLIILILFVVVAAIAALTYWYLTRDQESTDDAFTDGRAIAVAAHVSGYLTLLAVDDNQFVRQGDLLLQIEPKDYIAMRDQAAGQLAAAEAQLDDARLALDMASTIYPAQLVQARGQLEEAEGQLFQAQREYRRQHSVDRAATSQQSVDASTASLRIAQGREQQAKAQVVQAELVDQNIARAATRVKALAGQSEQARGALEQAEINLGYTRIAAPQDGWITKRSVERGNFLQAGVQLFAIVTPEVWITANFKETQLDRMRPGQRVRIDVDAYPDLHLEGHVDGIQLGSGSKFTAFPPENATGNFVKIVQRVPVKIRIDKGLKPDLPLPLGISVEPTVMLR
ncbi:MAG: rane fusion protein multidrug efflux system [Rhodospirillaceae bacterium]|jgi:membrane fusion protein (multidrug efflux system)|nr:rane fusion protein multidrug efflux system [Rhodospirillaceae bacterium]